MYRLGKERESSVSILRCDGFSNSKFLIPFHTSAVSRRTRAQTQRLFLRRLVDKIREFRSETGTSRTFERRQKTIQVAAVDVEHQSFICFEATSNQFHPSRLQANHVAEGRRRAKSIWMEEATDRQAG